MAGEWKQIGDALVTVLNTGTYSQSFTAKRVNLVDLRAEKEKLLRVEVAPLLRRKASFTRNGPLTVYTGAVFVIKLMSSHSSVAMIAEQDALIQLCDEIGESLDAVKAIGGGSFSTVDEVDKQLFDIESMREANLFLSRIDFTSQIQ